MMSPHRRFTALLVALALMLMVTASVAAAAGATASGTNEQLAEVRQATAAYHDVDAALTAGYHADDHCVDGMGFHYVKPELVDGTVDHEQPEVLVYAPVDGELELVAVEYLSTDEHAELFGERFDYTPQIDLYTLHAWVWRGNPDGVFNPTNASVECPAH